LQLSAPRTFLAHDAAVQVNICGNLLNFWRLVTLGPFRPTAAWRAFGPILFYRTVFYRVGSRYGTDGRTVGRAIPVMRPIRNAAQSSWT